MRMQDETIHFFGASGNYYSTGNLSFIRSIMGIYNLYDIVDLKSLSGTILQPGV